jgi:hypothetical protein
VRHVGFDLLQWLRSSLNSRTGPTVFHRFRTTFHGAGSPSGFATRSAPALRVAHAIDETGRARTRDGSNYDFADDLDGSSAIVDLAAVPNYRPGGADLGAFELQNFFRNCGTSDSVFCDGFDF